MAETVVSASATALAALLVKGGRVADAIRAEWSRSTLHRWATGRQVPDIYNAAKLASLTHNRVSVLGWVKPAPAPEVQP